MRKTILLMAAALLLWQNALCQDNFVYADATTLTVGGQICSDTYEPFSRLPGSLEGVCRPPVWSLGRTSAGVYVKFVSDAGKFNFRWKSTLGRNLDNMAAIGVRGLALYVHDKGEWVYAGTARPDKKEPDYTISCSKLKGQRKEYLLYLSLYDGVLELQIGVPEGCVIERSSFNSPRREKPVIAYGTSILQGASASHPGMAGTNMLSRMLDREVINLGFSGNALLDYEIARLMAAYPNPGVYVMDNLPNGSAELTREKLEGFFRILRDAHPDTPVVFVENPMYPGARFDKGREDLCTGKNEAMKEIYDALKVSGEKKLYYVSSKKMLLDDNIGTIEGTHFTDIGFTKWTSCLYPVLKKILKEEGQVKGMEALPAYADPELVGERIAEQLLTTESLMNYLPKGYLPSVGVGNGKHVHYSIVSLCTNALEFAECCGKDSLKTRLSERVKQLMALPKEKLNAANHVDYCILGALFLEDYMVNADKKALELGLYYADRQWAEPDYGNLGGNGNGDAARQKFWFDNGYTPQTRLWIDDMYMINLLQTQAYRATGDPKYIDRAAREMVMYLDSLQGPDGLFSHTADVPFIWGRGDGWMAAGMPTILKYLPKGSKYRKPILNGYCKMMETLLQWQRPDGLWGQLVTDGESWDETSCSAMFTYAMVEGLNHGWLPESKYGNAARKAWLALCDRLDKDANISDVCAGTAARNDRQWYMERPRVNGDPHGQAPMMWICNALLGNSMPLFEL